MVDAAPRIDSRLVAAVPWLDDTRQPMAETNRRIGFLARDLGLAKPSYEQIRTLVKQHRRGRLRPTAGRVLLDVAFRVRPPEALLEYLAGIPIPK
jgi:hypothetical protein